MGRVRGLRESQYTHQVPGGSPTFRHQLELIDMRDKLDRSWRMPCRWRKGVGIHHGDGRCHQFVGTVRRPSTSSAGERYNREVTDQSIQYRVATGARKAPSHGTQEVKDKILGARRQREEGLWDCPRRRYHEVAAGEIGYPRVRGNFALGLGRRKVSEAARTAAGPMEYLSAAPPTPMAAGRAHPARDKASHIYIPSRTFRDAGRA